MIRNPNAMYLPFSITTQTPENQLIRACIHAYVDDTPLPKNIPENLDYEKLYNVCEKHRLLLIVHYYFIHPNKTRLPEKIVNFFSEESKKIVYQQLQLMQQMHEIRSAFEDKKITYVFLKGPILGKKTGDNTLLRYSNDIDVLVLPEHIEAAHQCLEALGYGGNMAVSKMKKFSKQIYFGFKKDALYTRFNSPFRIELHWRLTYLLPVKNLNQWENFTTTESFQEKVFPVLSEPFNLLYLCLHAANHHWMRAFWLIDIALLMRKKGITPEHLLSFSKKYYLENIPKEALYLLYDWLGFEIYKPFTFYKYAKRLKKRIYLENFLSNITNFPWYLRGFLFIYRDSLVFFGVKIKIRTCFFYFQHLIKRFSPKEV